MLHAANQRLATHDIIFVNCCHGEYVASYRLASPAVLRKASRQNFSASEIAILTGKVEENLFIIQSKLTNTVIQRQKKNEIWYKIAEAVNAKGVAQRTTAEVREKWKNLHSQAKKEFTELAKEQKKTGGGEAPKMLVAAIAKIIDLFKETPSFTGLEGFESKGDDYYPLVFKT